MLLHLFWNADGTTKPLQITCGTMLKKETEGGGGIFMNIYFYFWMQFVGPRHLCSYTFISSNKKLLVSKKILNITSSFPMVCFIGNKRNEYIYPFMIHLIKRKIKSFKFIHDKILIFRNINPLFQFLQGITISPVVVLC